MSGEATMVSSKEKPEGSGSGFFGATAATAAAGARVAVTAAFDDLGFFACVMKSAPDAEGAAVAVAVALLLLLFCERSPSTLRGWPELRRLPGFDTVGAASLLNDAPLLLFFSKVVSTSWLMRTGAGFQLLALLFELTPRFSWSRVADTKVLEWVSVGDALRLDERLDGRLLRFFFINASSWGDEMPRAWSVGAA